MMRGSLLVCAAVLAGCAPVRAPLRATAGPVAPHPGAAPPARQRFEPGKADVVFARAVEVLEERGYRLARCDPGFSLAETEPTEDDAVCGGTTCLARDVVAVKVGWRAVRVELRREVFDTALRGWVEPRDPRAVAAIEDEQRILVADVFRAVRAPGFDTSRDPCASAGFVAAAIPAPGTESP